MRRNELASRRHRCARSGLTLIEVIVVLGIALVMLAITLPAINDSRECVYRFQCESQMRRVSTAFHSYAAANNGELPMLRGPLLESDSDPSNPLRPASWPVQLLPYLDMELLYDHLISCRPAINANPKHPDSFASLSSVTINVYNCPDSSRFEEPGRLTCVVNMGYMTSDIWDDPTQARRHQVSGTYNWNNGPTDENSAEDEAVSRATGLILDDVRGVAQRLDQVPDGQSHTILLSENLNAGRWISGEPHEVGFAVRIGGTATQIPLAAESRQGLGADTPETALQLSPGGKAGVIDLGPSAINANPDPAARGIPRPSSVHPGCVNVFFCDGSGRTVSDKIDPSVYARLISSGGARRGQALDIDDF